jgi:serine phosphatase RsbU (regulator of sigma subunit)
VNAPIEDSVGGAPPGLDERLAACVSSYRLFSLDPDVVLAETAHLLADAAPGADVVVLPLHRLGVPRSPDLPPERYALVEQAVAARAPVLTPDGRVLVQPLVAGHAAMAERRDEASPRPVGVVLLESPTALPAAALTLVASLAERAAVALEHALLYEMQAQIAQQLQRRLLPLEKPTIEGLELGTLFQPRTQGADIGGDFIDFVSLSPNQVAVCVGDVSGKGIAAAAVTVIAKYALRAITSTLSWPTWPGEALRDLHNALQGQMETESFVTVVFGLIDVARRTLSVASAGHPAPFLVRDGVAQQPMLLTAPAIALVDYSELEPLPTERLALEPGDTLLFFTDGLSELRDTSGRFYQDAGLPQALQRLAELPPERLVEALHADAMAFAGNVRHDDIALVAARLLP